MLRFHCSFADLRRQCQRRFANWETRPNAFRVGVFRNHSLYLRLGESELRAEMPTEWDKAMMAKSSNDFITCLSAWRRGGEQVPSELRWP